MRTPEPKVCRSCGREITWRRKWARDWDHVLYCSASCRRTKIGPLGRRIEQTMIEMVTEAPARTVTIDEVARVVAGDAQVSWADLQQQVRSAARRLAAAQQVQIMQNGHVADPLHVRGPLHIRRHPAHAPHAADPRR